FISKRTSHGWTLARHIFPRHYIPGSFYLVNLILAIVAMSYDELQKKAEEEEEAAQAEEEALRVSLTGAELNPLVRRDRGCSPKATNIFLIWCYCFSSLFRIR
ncbi:Sodium channel protein, partial [Caligus rogercresseyi]